MSTYVKEGNNKPKQIDYLLGFNEKFNKINLSRENTD
jgi:hypothetical protein